jgi:hypothetical protein
MRKASFLFRGKLLWKKFTLLRKYKVIHILSRNSFRNESSGENLRNFMFCKYIMKISHLIQIFETSFAFFVETLRRWQHFHIFVYFAKMRKWKFWAIPTYSPHKILVCKAPQSFYPHLLKFSNLRVFYYEIFMATASGLQLSNHFLPVSDPNLFPSLHATHCS